MSLGDTKCMIMPGDLVEEVRSPNFKCRNRFVLPFAVRTWTVLDMGLLCCASFDYHGKKCAITLMPLGA